MALIVLSLHALVLLLRLPLVASSSAHCTQLRVPLANVEHTLVHVDSFEQIEDVAQVTCASHGVPNYKCESVRRELRETLREMAPLALREAVVNVSLDRSLAYDVWMLNESTNEQQLAPEPLVVYPEQPLADTMAEYCTRYKLDAQSCEIASNGITDLVARDWGCDDPVDGQQTEDPIWSDDEAFIEIPVILDQQPLPLRLRVTADMTLETARICREKWIDMAECMALLRVVHDRAKRLQQETPDQERDADGRRRLRVLGPVETRMYPHSERIFINLDWERSSNGSDESVDPIEVCMRFDYNLKQTLCLMVPSPGPVYITDKTMAEGYHLVFFTNGSGHELLAARAFQVVIPKVELLHIATTISGHSEAMTATIRTTSFDPFDPLDRICILLDDSFECLDPEWLTVETSEMRHGTRTEPFRQSTTFRAPLGHAPLQPGGKHEVSVILLSGSNKVLAISDTTSFDAGPDVNRDPSRVHLLDKRLHTPQRPQTCPDTLLSSSTLRWICELWHHEWGMYSQNGEDGILREIFRQVGVEHKTYVEFGTQDGQECNTRLLREAHGWSGLLMDSGYEDPSIQLHREFITRENLMTLLGDKYKTIVRRDLDLLSVDVDFNDFWLLSAVDLTRVSPRVIIVEVNSHIPTTEARTVPYNDREDSGGWDGHNAYFGASVAAFHQWGARNGYSLVYCESHGVNCFLVRNDVLGGDVNVSAVLGPEQLQNPPNFFGHGWDYPNEWKPHHQWIWL
ncbi:hypothetical protein BBJ28_00016724 [Nothophytophthora sp. Chile5]|nr:hypothetical protein BBJ28_00016724 [Nothophytophthora sp. Chile5]